MPQAAAARPSTDNAADRIGELLLSAMQFVSPERGKETIGKWLPRGEFDRMSGDELTTMMADAVLLSADLALSQPSASGATAFDRLARSRSGAPAAEAAAILALCKARFRLLKLEADAQGADAKARDVISRESLHIVGAELPPLPAGTALFGRVAMLGDGRCCLAGAITPLDPAAFAAARGHVAAGATSVAAGVRWADAVYGHVVRYGTLDIPGLNRPGEDFEDEVEAAGGTLYGLAAAWLALGDGPPDAELLQHTRQHADLPTILDALTAAVLARKDRQKDMAAAFERLLLAMLETVLRRERAGSGTTLTLDGLAQALDRADAEGRVPPGARALFATLRQRLAGSSGGRRADDPALERLVQRIQGLRAKTVAQGCTEQEALAAAEKVAELLDRHGLSLGELDFRAQPCEGIGIQTDRRRFAPIDSCVPTIAAFFDCRVWVEHAKGTALRYVFFGLRGDVEAAQYLYEMVERAFETETDAFRRSELYVSMAGERRSASNSFQIGMAQGINRKLRTMRDARDAHLRSASGRDLVPVKAAMVDEELEKLGLDLHARKTGGQKRVLVDAFREGEAAGQRFEYAPAITDAA